LPYTDLRDWIKTLDKAGELRRIKQPVAPYLEMSEIADRTAKLGKGTSAAGGPALLFENVTGFPGARVLMNQFGSLRRMKLALDLDKPTDSLDHIADRIRILIKPETPTSFMDKLKLLPMLAEIGSFFPKVISARDAACKQVIHHLTPEQGGPAGGKGIDLLKLPVLTTWPQDGGPFITLPCVITRDPKSGKRNVGMYRMQVYDAHSTGMHWQRQKNAAEQLRDRLRAATDSSSTPGAPGLASETWDLSARVDLMARTSGGTTPVLDPASIPTRTVTKVREGRMEVAVAIGTDPATTFSAIVPAPPEIEEYLIAGFLRGKPAELVKAETVDLEVPAHAEYILEGYVNLGELRTEGPFGDHTGFYTMQDQYPVFHITCITHRKDPIYAATVVGKPPMEDAWMGKAVERIFLPLMQLTMPEIVDVCLPPEGVFHNLMIVAIRKSYAGHARKVMNGIWAMGQAMFTKCIVVVDEDCDPQDLAEVTLRTANNIDPERDIQFTLGPVDTLDHASRLPNFGSKMGIDATRKWPAEGFTRQWPPMLKQDPGISAKIDAIWDKLGIV
jgi:4-hydroxy-3-polyprenylbenzoate decarboxylase